MPRITFETLDASMASIAITTEDGDTIEFGPIAEGDVLRMESGVIQGTPPDDVPVDDTNLGEMAEGLATEQTRGKLIVETLQTERMRLPPELEDLP